LPEIPEENSIDEVGNISTINLSGWVGQ